MKIRACKMGIGADQINLNVRCPKVCAGDSRGRASCINENHGVSANLRWADGTQDRDSFVPPPCVNQISNDGLAVGIRHLPTVIVAPLLL